MVYNMDTLLPSKKVKYSVVRKSLNKKKCFVALGALEEEVVNIDDKLCIGEQLSWADWLYRKKVMKIHNSLGVNDPSYNKALREIREIYDRIKHLLSRVKEKSVGPVKSTKNYFYSKNRFRVSNKATWKLNKKQKDEIYILRKKMGFSYGQLAKLVHISKPAVFSIVSVRERRSSGSVSSENTRKIQTSN